MGVWRREVVDVKRAMKVIFPVAVAVAVILRVIVIVIVLGLLSLNGGTEFVVAADPVSEARRKLMERTGGGTGIISPGTRQPPQVTTVYLTYVSPLREWTATDGRTMQGRLLAFSAPKPGEEGPVIVIKEEKIRLLRSGTKKPAEITLSALSEADQKYVRNISEAAKKSSAAPKKQ